MIVKEVCKRCKCVDWYSKNGEYYCKNCNYDRCSAHKWFIPCDESELTSIEGKVFFAGNLKDYLGEECD